MYVPYVPFIRQEEDPSLAINYVILIRTNKSNIIAKPGSSAGSAMPTANAATCANGTVGSQSGGSERARRRAENVWEIVTSSKEGPHPPSNSIIT